MLISSHREPQRGAGSRAATLNSSGAGRPVLRHASEAGMVFMALALVIQSAAAQTTSAGEANRAAISTPAPVSLVPRAYAPMTRKEQRRYFIEHLFSGESVLRSAAGSGITQALDMPHEWGEGAIGYGQRFASSYGGHIVQSTVMYGVSAMLGEDNRYFSSGEPGAGARIKYAIGSTFLARHKDGSRHFSWSRITSYFAAAAISRAWQPPSTRGPLCAAGSFAVGVGVEAGFNMAREFLPKLLHARPALAGIEP